MNKEEIDNLEDYLKNKLPKIEPTIFITNFESINLDDLMDSIKQFKKVPTSYELLRENKRLRAKLEERDKVIGEAIKYIKSKKVDYEPYELTDFEVRKLLEILERGKNGKSN